MAKRSRELEGGGEYLRGVFKSASVVRFALDHTARSLYFCFGLSVVLVLQLPCGPQQRLAYACPGVTWSAPGWPPPGLRSYIATQFEVRVFAVCLRCRGLDLPVVFRFSVSCPFAISLPPPPDMRHALVVGLFGDWFGGGGGW